MNVRQAAPPDQLFVWAHIPGSTVPELCGVLMLHAGRMATFAYDPLWLESPRAFALSADLPLIGSTFDPPAGCQIHPIFDDAGPDRWGRAVIHQVFDP
ncbi:HipA N-terminal domain-containing protein [Actimicrobium antarcticum]|uniref:HipA N-terminal subdomain 1 domain-containing protein n=1 Tax=Actimicrobium antarcticum TaxID=1051899 RepID=A0ABP7TII1_9BURK